jgi:hypothetical protein
VQRNPLDESSKKQLDLTQRVLALDPDARGLAAAARYQRSKELLQAEIAQFDRCQPGNKATDPARKALASHPRRRALDDATGHNLSLAKDLWTQEQKLCGVSPHPDAVSRVLARLSK